jgi:heme exporter protein CcmD
MSNDPNSFYVIMSYASAAAVIAVLVLSTWLRGRKTKHTLDTLTHSEPEKS